MKLAIALTAQVLAGDFQRRRTCVNAMQPPHSWRHEAGPASAPTTEIKPYCRRRQLWPRENGKMLLKPSLKLARSHITLVELSPFLAECPDYCTIRVAHPAPLTC